MGTIHYGIKLKRFMEKNGTTKRFMADKVGCSRPTLNDRLLDGEFTPDELKKVKKIISKK